MKKWIAVLMVVLSTAAHSATAQEATRRGEFEPPVQSPAVPETTIPAPAPDSDPIPSSPAGVPAVDNPDKPILPHPMPEPTPMSKMPTTTTPAATAGPAAAPVPGCAAPGCAGCQASCKRSCCAKIADWICFHRQKTPDFCYRVDHPNAQVYTYFLDYPCRSESITAVGPASSCQCKKACPWEGCIFGQFLGNGNLCCH